MKISWPVFLDAIPKQHPGYMEVWLQGWAFDDKGPVLVEQISKENV